MLLLTCNYEHAIMHQYPVPICVYMLWLYLLGHFALVGAVVVEDCVGVAVLDAGYQPGKTGHEVAK